MPPETTDTSLPLRTTRGSAPRFAGRQALHRHEAYRYVGEGEWTPVAQCARSGRPTRRLCRSDETRAADERDPLEASLRRRWRESSKRSSASVGAGAPFRGKGIARPEQPREPKQSWRAQCPRAWMSAIATARQVCWAADSEQAQSRVAWARAVPRDAATSITRPSLGHALAVISSLPAHTLLPIVHSTSRRADGSRASSARRSDRRFPAVGEERDAGGGCVDTCVPARAGTRR